MVKKSTSIDLVEKDFDSKLKGQWCGGSNQTETLFTELYLKKHYNSILHFVPHIDLLFKENIQLNKIKYCFGIIDYETNIIWNDDEEDYNKIIKKYSKLFRNTKKRFTFIPVDKYKVVYYNGVRNIKDGHSQLYLYDKKLNIVEYFNSDYDFDSGYSKSVTKFFIELYGEKIKIVNYWTFPVARIHYANCNDINYNFTSPGYCSIWTLWYIDIRLKNNEIPLQVLVQKIENKLKNNGTLICKLIIGYAQFVKNIIKNHSIETDRNGKLVIIQKEIVKKSTTPLYISKKKSTTLNRRRYIIPTVLISFGLIAKAIMYAIKKLNKNNTI